MNRNCYRLVLSRRLGFRVPVAEHMSARPKGASKAAVATTFVLLATQALAAGDLPTAAAQFISPNSPGSANAPVITGTTMTIEQTTQAPVVMQWQNFDIGAQNTVRFVQPNAQSRAINVVLPGGPRSDIYGALQANGQVYLFNQAGILFGPGARIDVGGLVASTLKLNDKLIEQSLSALSGYNEDARTYVFGEAALSKEGTAGDITIEQGARIVAAENGRVLIAAPNVTNAGQISTPGGQTIIAAGEKLYLADSIDTRLRGVLVEVTGGGTVTNEGTGDLLAERGNITLAGLNVDQQGRAAATTSVTLNGSIYLKAASRTSTTSGALGQALTTGTVTLGHDSQTTVTPETDADDTLRDDASFNRSEIDILGKRIALSGDARVAAAAGNVMLAAQANRGAGGEVDSTDISNVAIEVSDSATIDVSGLDDVLVAADRDVVEVELRADEFKDAPLQRDPASGRALYGTKVSIDVVKGFDVADGATPLADISGYRRGIERDVAELSTAAGTIALQSDNVVNVGEGTTLDVSGGSMRYTVNMPDGEHLVARTQLETAAGTWVAVENARADVRYSGNTRTVYERPVDRVVGGDAGRLVVSGRQVSLDGAMRASTINGIEQRQADVSASRWFDWTYAGDANELASFRADIESQLLERDRVRMRVERYVGNAQTRAKVVQTGRLGWDGSTRAQGGVFELRVDTENLAATPSVSDIVLSDTLPPIGERAAEAFYVASSMMSQHGFDQISLAGRGRFTVASGTELNAAAGSRLEVTAREVVVAEGASLTLPGGQIALTTIAPVADQPQGQSSNGITVEDGATLSVAGLWTNDRVVTPTPYNPRAVVLDGGDITLTSSSDMTIHGVLDVSAGAWQKNNGSFSYGDAGALTLSTGSFGDGTVPQRSLSFGDAAVLKAFAAASFNGLAGGRGGAISIETSAIRVGATDAPDAADPVGTLVLTPDFFATSGFADFSLNGKVAVSIDAGTSIAPVVYTHVVGKSQFATADARALDGAALRLDSSFIGGPTRIAFASDEAAVGRFSLGEGAQVSVSPGGEISIDAAARIDVDGRLSARGGRVALTTDPAVPVLANLDQLDPTANIHLGQSARVDVSGVRVLDPGSLYREGVVLDGGQVDINAGHGYVVMQSGAQILADGTQGLLDVISPFGGLERDRSIASAGGQVSISAREGLLLAGVISAASGRPGSTPGGSLALTLVADGQWAGVTGEAYAGDLNPDRVLTLTAGGEAGADAIAAGAVVPSAQSLGTARIDADKIAQGGFQDVSLASSDTIAFEGDVDLSVPGRLSLEAPNLKGDASANVALTAASVRLGQSQTRSLRKTPDAPISPTGTGQLAINAEEIDVAGEVVIDGFAHSRLSAQDALRLSGLDNGDGLIGRLATNGDLTLAAGVLYPTSGADVSVEIRNSDSGTLRIEAVGSDALPLSAFGELALIAPHVVQAGRVRAPFGQISLTSGQLTDTGASLGSRDSVALPDGTVTLADGSITSVSASGQTIPFGQTQVAGREWVFNTGAGLEAIEAGPDKQVSLSGAHIDLAEGARLDLAGGGDLAAWEFVAGRGGSTDFLAAEADTFALVPTIGSGAAPVAADTWAGGTVSVGSVVRIESGIGGLPAGDYTLLPARYGLMAGAYTLRVRAGSSDLQATEGFVAPDGINVVAARFGQKTTTGVVFSDRTVGVEIFNGDDVRLRSEYIETLASDFFDDASPADAGRLSLAAGSDLNLQAIVSANAAAGGRGSQVDLTAERLAVLAAGQPAQAGEVVLTPEMIATLNAQSLLLGAQRTRATDADTGETAWQIDAGGAAAQVRVDTAGGDALSAPEVILAARETVRIEDGSRIEASAGADTAPQTFVMNGGDTDGAFVHVSSGGGVEVVRNSPSGAQGDVFIGVDAVLAGRSITVDSTRNVDLAGASPGVSQFELTAAGGTVTFSGSRLGFGDVPAGMTGLSLSESSLAELGDAGTIVLRSYSTVDLFGATDVGSSALGELLIDAAGVVSHAEDGQTQTIRAKTITLKNSGALATTDAASVAGTTLALEAQTIALDASGDGAPFSFTGADSNDWSAIEQVIGRGRGQYRVGDDLRITAGRVAVATLADTTLDVGGSLEIAAAGPAPEAVAGLAGSFDASAETIIVSGTVEATAGRVALLARTGDLAVDAAPGGSTASLSATGATVSLGPDSVALDGGQIRLESAQGQVLIGADARVDVSASGEAAAGAIDIVATEGALTLDGELAATGAGGSLSIDVARLGDATGDMAALAARAQDFSEAIAVRVRSGDLALGSGDNLVARQIGLFVDDGRLTLAGTLYASGDVGGTIRAYANAGQRTGSGVLTVAGAQLLARGFAGEGGEIELGVSADDGSAHVPSLVVGAGTLDVSGSTGEGGRIAFSAPRTADGTGVAMSPIDTGVTALVGADAIEVTGYQREYASEVVTSGDNSATRLNLGGVFELAADAMGGAGISTNSAQGVSAREVLALFGRSLLGARDGDDYEALARADGGSWLGAIMGDLVGDASGNPETRLTAASATDAAFREVSAGADLGARSVASVFVAGLEQLGVSAAAASAVGVEIQSAVSTGASAAQVLASARSTLDAQGFGAGTAGYAMLSASGATELVSLVQDVSNAAGAAGDAGSAQSALSAAIGAFGTQRALTAAQAGALATQVWKFGNADTGRYGAYARTMRFVGHADDMLASLGLGNLAGTSARAEIQVRSDADLSVNSAVDFGNVAVTANAFTPVNAILPVWQSGAHAGRLTLMAAGDVNINKSIVDGKTRRYISSSLPFFPSGYMAESNNEFALARTPSWALRVVSGAQAGAANPLAVRATDGVGAGSTTLAQSAVLRTGTASIDVAAQGDVVLGGNSAAIYTIGTLDAGAAAFRESVGLSRTAQQYGAHGGDVTVRAGESVMSTAGVAADVSGWLVRQGAVDANGAITQQGAYASNPTWTVTVANFKQGIGTLGGGDVVIEAGADVRNLTLATATTGRVVGAVGETVGEDDLVVAGGGDLSVTAAGDLAGSTLYAGRGEMQVKVGGAVGETPVNIALGDAVATIQAHGDASIADVVNPTLKGTSTGTYFSTYGDRSGVSVRSAIGDVALGGLAIGPTRLGLAAPLGEITVSESSLVPGDATALRILAAGDVTFEGTMRLSSLDPDSMPSPWQPATRAPDLEIGVLDADPTAVTSEGVVVVTSADGDIVGPDHRTGGADPALASSLPVAVYSGGDIRDFSIEATHGRLDQVSTVTAQGDIVFAPKVVEATGELDNTSVVGLLVDGPGRLAVTAGGDIDLGNSLGIVAYGNTNNSYLPEMSAAIDVLAGAGGADYTALLAMARPGAATGDDLFDQSMFSQLQAAGARGSLEAILGQEKYAELASRRNASRAELNRLLDRYDAALLAHMQGLTSDDSLEVAGATALFAGLSAEEQGVFHQQMAPVLNQVLFATLRYSGRVGDALGAGASGYAPGFAVLDATFPEGGAGNIEGFLSQFKTVQDVETPDSLLTAGLAPEAQEHATAIALLAPFGGINVGVPGGVAGDPTRTGVVAVGKGNVDLVARDSIEVGPSRIFTLGGGAIQVWSSLADIDGGSAPKTAAATPQPTLLPKGDSFVLDVSASVSGGGIATLKKLPTVRNAPVRLYAPNGSVDAGDAGIRVSGDLEVGAQQIIGAENISVGGSLSSSAAPAPASAPAVAPVASNAGDAIDEANQMLENEPTAAGASGDSSLLTVEVLGVGEPCDENDPARKRGECGL